MKDFWFRVDFEFYGFFFAFLKAMGWLDNVPTSWCFRLKNGLKIGF